MLSKRIHCRLVQWHYLVHVPQDQLSKTVRLLLWHSIWNSLQPWANNLCCSCWYVACRCRFNMMLYCEFFQVYIVISESIIVKDFRWFFIIQDAIKTCVLWWVGMCHLHIVLQRKGHSDAVKLLIGYCHSKRVINHQSIGYCMWCNPKSYNRSYMHFCVPWILEVVTNDPCAGNY